jgi:hypothetical protein
MEIFKISPPALYFDLDTIIKKDLNGIIEKLSNTKFSCLRDIQYGSTHANPYRNSMNSTAMFWSCDMTSLYKKFEFSAEENMRIFKRGGDQSYISKNIPLKYVTFIQDILPDEFKSYKGDYLKNPQCLDKASVIYFHGKPRPWEQNKIPYDNIQK